MRLITILYLLLLLTSCTNRDKDEKLFSSLDRQSLYPALFNAEAKDGWCYWKPSVAEGDSCNVSFSGICNTRLDTILYISEGITNRAVIIFGTYQFNEFGQDHSHVAAPMVSVAVVQKMENSYWKIIKFIKNFGQHGSYGEQPQYGIIRFGKHFFLYEDWGYLGQGCMESWKIFWHLPSLVESLKTEGLDDSGTDVQETQVTSWQENVKDASEGNITRVVVNKNGIIYEQGKGQRRLMKAGNICSTILMFS